MFLQYNLKNNISYFIFLAVVVLVGGTTNGTGNVFARNPTTGIYGPVCDDFWDINDVSTYLNISTSGKSVCILEFYLKKVNMRAHFIHWVRY